MSEPALARDDEIPRLLADFDCCRGLAPQDLLVLASRASLERLRRGVQLFAEGDDDEWMFLLVEGSLSLTAGDGRSHQLHAGTNATGHPVARLKPRRFTARTDTPALVLRIDATGLGNWQTALSAGAEHSAVDAQQLIAPGMLLEELDADELDACLDVELDTHRRRIEAGELALPSLPAVAMEARRIIDRDVEGPSELARVLLNDPAITAKLIRAANSPLFYGRRSVETCERAIHRLGLRTTRQLVVAFAMREVFASGDGALEVLAAALWAHSTRVAAFSFVLARRLGGVDADEAQLAGLLHDIGAVPVLGYASDQEELRSQPHTVAALAAALRVHLGCRMLRDWGFGSVLEEVVRRAEDWWYDEPRPSRMADLVMVAQLLSFIGTPQAMRVPPLVRLPAFRRLFGEGAGAEQVRNLVDEAGEQVEQIRALLAG